MTIPTTIDFFTLTQVTGGNQQAAQAALEHSQTCGRLARSLASNNQLVTAADVQACGTRRPDIFKEGQRVIEHGINTGIYSSRAPGAWW